MRSRPRQPRQLVQILISAVAFAILVHFHSVRTVFRSTVFHPSVRHICHFTYVNIASPLCGPTDSRLVCWQLVVTSQERPTPHRLSVPAGHGNDTLSPLELTLLLKLRGCMSRDTCRTSVPCSYGIEDPSDVFWLRRYSESSKFVVLFDIGLATLIFFICAIIVDCSIFYPHRQGIALGSASALLMLGLASLLYVLIVPRSMQFSLYGSGAWNSIAYVFVVLVIATLLPAFAVIWISSVLFFIFFLGFIFEQVLVVLLGTFHFITVFIVYQLSNMVLHVRLVYFPDDDDVDEHDYDARLLAMGETFLRNIRSNWFISRLPRMLEERALQFTQNHMPDHVHEQLLRENVVPQLEFESVDDLAQIHSSASGSSQALPSQAQHNEAGTSNVTEATPLLNSNAGP